MTDLFTDDGFISAKDLELSMGRGADVKQMIAAADKNGDGKVREPWTSGLRNRIPVSCIPHLSQFAQFYKHKCKGCLCLN